VGSIFETCPLGYAEISAERTASCTQMGASAYNLFHASYVPAFTRTQA